MQTASGYIVADAQSTGDPPIERTENAMMTRLGGFAVRLMNNSGSTIPHGTAVSASPDNDKSVVPQSVEFDTIGFAYGDIPTGKYGWVVTSGFTEALLKDGTSAVRGYWARASATDGRIEVTTAPSGLGALDVAEHFKEVGHCVESKNAGTNVLALIVLHFL